MRRHVILFRDRGEALEDSGPTRNKPENTSSSSSSSSSSHFSAPPLSPSVDPYELLLAEAGFASVSIPVLNYDFVNLDELAKQLADFRRFHGLILTSPRAVQALETVLSSAASDDTSVCASASDSDSVSSLRLPIFVVGAATQKIAESQLSPILKSIKYPRFSSSTTTSPSSSPSPSSPSPSSCSSSSYVNTSTLSCCSSCCSSSCTSCTCGEAPGKRLNFLGSESNNAKNLAEFIVEHFQPKLREGMEVLLLYPGSSIRNPSFQERLERAGIRVVGLSVYKTEARLDVEKNLEEWAKNRKSDEEKEEEGLKRCRGPHECKEEENGRKKIEGVEGIDQEMAFACEPISKVPSTHPDSFPLPPPPLPHPDVCVFFSPSGVKAASSAFVSLQWPVDEILQVAVGPTTLKALEAKGYRRKAMATKPNPERVVEAVLESRRK